MLQSLSIENYALIEKLSINFNEGFSTITGETGAGKSILLGALGLILGKRADLTSLKNKEEKCVIEAQFDIKKYNLATFFQTNDLDYDAQTIIRREIFPSGKSRAFINDTPVNLAELQHLGTFLIDIHSQHQTQELSENEMQFNIIDLIANNSKFLLEYSLILSQYKKSKITLETKKNLLHDAIKEQDYNSFLLSELLAANLKIDEQKELETQFEALNNVEFIKENLAKSLSISNDEQFGVLQGLKEIKAALQKNQSFSINYNLLYERLNSILIEFDDIEKELQLVAENLQSNPSELEKINEKLQLIYTLQKKHNVATIDDLLKIQNNLDSKVISVITLENEIKNLEDEILIFEEKLNQSAKNISQERQKAIPVLIEKLTIILQLLGMQNARFEVNLEPSNTFLSNGKETLDFLFSANKGSSFANLKKVASGGEMSRIMLAIKHILAQYSNLPTIIFDEIDTGVSGEIADKMGDIMKQMSHNMQVFSITHLPQIASKGNHHYKVFKTVENNQTQTKIIEIIDNDRVTEIAQMLSGATISQSALQHAKELLN